MLSSLVCLLGTVKFAFFVVLNLLSILLIILVYFEKQQFDEGVIIFVANCTNNSHWDCIYNGCEIHYLALCFLNDFLKPFCLPLSDKYNELMIHELLYIIWFIFPGRVCPLTGKKANRANKVSFSNHKTKKLQFVNLQYKKVWWEAGKRYVKLRLSTKALKTIEKNGLDAVAKKAGIDLRKE